MVLGDFNCSLDACAAHVGCAKFHSTLGLTLGVQHADAGQFLSIVRAHGLVALNSFCPSLGPTYTHGTHCSRIVFTRLNTADGCAKNVKYLHDLPFLNAKKVGHVPMMCQLKRYWVPPGVDSGTAGISAQQRLQGRNACFSDTEQWRHFMCHSERCLTEFLQNVGPSDPEFISKLHATASVSFRDCFPAGQGSSSTQHWSLDRSIILDKWKHRACCKQLQIVNPRNVLHAWFHMARFQALKRLHKRHAWQVRHNQFAQILVEAQHAANCHDSHKLFQTISKFCPKQPRRRVQLRNQVGSIASPVEELAILSAFVQTVWHGPDAVPMSNDVTGMPFSEHDLMRALQSIPACKAVAKPFVAGYVWKSHAALLTPYLYRALEMWSGSSAYIPQHWKDGWMLLIPKPAKPPVKPEALRPLALQEPLGKSVIGLLAQIAKDESQFLMVTLPLWAYMSQRSTQHALQRVAEHCRKAWDHRNRLLFIVSKIFLSFRFVALCNYLLICNVLSIPFQDFGCLVDLVRLE